MDRHDRHSIGEAGEPVFALALSSGGLNAVFHLGAAHALLACGGRAPHVIAGISAGAVNAAAIAEVLQARAANQSATAVLRRFIKAYEEAPDELLRSWLPDPLDLAHDMQQRTALRLPIYPTRERAEHEAALERKRGLAQAIDYMLALPLRASPFFSALERLLLRPTTSCQPSVKWAMRWAAFQSPRAASQLLWLKFRLWLRWRKSGKDALERSLARFSLRDALAGEHGLRTILVRLFDPTYHGRTDLHGAVERALQGSAHPGDNGGTVPQRPLSSYRKGAPSIEVVPLAANLRSGYLDSIPETVPLVDALLAATSRTPLLPAVSLDSAHFAPQGGPSSPSQSLYFVDGANVSDEPVTAVVRHLRSDRDGHPRIHPEATAVHVYPVSPIPARDAALQTEGDGFGTPSQIALRALDLERARRATIERRITRLYSRMLPAGRALHVVWVRRRNRRLELATKDAPRAFPRWFIRAQIHPIEPDRPLRLGQLTDRPDLPTDRRTMWLRAVAEGCRATLEATIQDAIHAASETGRPGTVVPCAAALEKRLPVTHPRARTLPEVCGACERNLRVLTQEAEHPTWPVDRSIGNVPALEPPPAADKSQKKRPPPDRHDPTISLLCSGGVFRGVFQLGVVSALLESGLRPDIIAGSSVGSLTAAMAGEIFVTPPSERRRLLSDLASTYLSLDKLVHTDRLFAAVGRFLRAGAGTRFSLVELRGLLGSRRPLSPEARESVLRDIQRLAFLAPTEVDSLVASLHGQRYEAFATQAIGHLDRMLQRSGVGLELLGSEPLATIIRERLLSRPSNAGDAAHTFARFGDITFLATTTDIASGELVILGDPTGDFPPDKVSLLEGVLASSAFPGVFRPRWSWEVHPGIKEHRAFVDGGILDNLPLDAVARYLDRNSRTARQPTGAPHLILTASLEPVVHRSVQAKRQDEMAASWRKRSKRVKELRNNRKVEQYAVVQRDLRLLDEAMGASATWEPMHIEVTNVVPRWLVPTFGVHPALGFDVEAQAASIAHGCATTLRMLARLERNRPDWAERWNLETGVDRKPIPGAHEGGLCWLRSGHPCPFGAPSLAEQGHAPATRGALERIHAMCPGSDRAPG